AQVLAPDCAPLFLTDGFREYLTALLTHYGHWVQPERTQTHGPTPKPRWMPRPQLLYAHNTRNVKHLGRFSSHVWSPGCPCSRCGACAVPRLGGSVDVYRAAPAAGQRAARVAKGDVVSISRALSVSPRASRIHAQHVARCDSYNSRNGLPPKKLRREIQ